MPTKTNGWDRVRVINMPCEQQAEYLFTRVLNKGLYAPSHLINMIDAVSRRLYSSVKTHVSHKHPVSTLYHAFVHHTIACAVSNPITRTDQCFWYGSHQILPVTEESVQRACMVCAAYLGLDDYVISALDAEAVWSAQACAVEVPYFGNLWTAAARGGQLRLARLLLERHEPSPLFSSHWRTVRANAIRAKQWTMFALLSTPVHLDRFVRSYVLVIKASPLGQGNSSRPIAVTRT